VQLSHQIYITKNNALYKECDRLCFASKNLYNQALWRIRNHWINNKKYLNYCDINRQMVSENQIDYRNLPANVSQQTLRMLDKNYVSYFKALKEFDKSPTKFHNIPKPPNFLDKTKGRFVVTYSKNTIMRMSLKKKGILTLTGNSIKIPTSFTFEQIDQVRIVPKSNLYIIEIIYKKESEPTIISNNFCGIDIGLNNVTTLGFNNKNIKPIIVNGRPLKSINQYYNKKRSILQSKLTKFKSSKKIKKLTQKRNNKIKDGLHKTSRKITNYLKNNKISNVVIGLNKEWKHTINIGKRNNQNFANIPHSQLIQMITYKCQLAGITVNVREESYTSKCSFYDNETIRKHTTYQGTRMKRGLFKSSNGFKYNADLNGALNILKKEFPNCFQMGLKT